PNTSTLEANGTIVWDPRLKKWVMFALGFAPTYQGPSGDKTRLFRFTSSDALHWIKGDDGHPERIAIDLHDPVSGADATNVDVFSCCYNARDREYPYQGWLWFANWGPGREGAYFMRSRDGKTWERGRMIVSAEEGKISQDGRELRGAGDVTTLYQDPEQARFLALIKYASPVEVGPGNRLRARAYAFVDRLDQPLDLKRVDRVELVPAAAEANGDHPHDEYYAATAWRYGSQWLGGLKVWHGGGDHPYSAAGCAYLKLATSRDGLRWSKVRYPGHAGEPEVWLPNGKEGGGGGRNDGGYLTEFSQGPLRVGDELIYYYGCSSFGKNHPRGLRVTGGGIFRSRLRVDGFVSVDGGTLTTRPVTFEGAELELNAVGPVSVELQDAGGKRLGSATVLGDSVRHRVSFAGRSLQEAGGRGAVRLRFTVGEGGRLYSFTGRQ
ncbi:MAG: hypothetical protein K0Q72_3874, partial [Armatimonadetes bacterium]|nr:hypothetical protein [Armatimonadota bacterium]